MHRDLPPILLTLDIRYSNVLLATLNSRALALKERPSVIGGSSGFSNSLAPSAFWEDAKNKEAAERSNRTRVQVSRQTDVVTDVEPEVYVMKVSYFSATLKRS